MLGLLGLQTGGEKRGLREDEPQGQRTGADRAMVGARGKLGFSVGPQGKGVRGRRKGRAGAQGTNWAWARL